MSSYAWYLESKLDELSANEMHKFTPILVEHRMPLLNILGKVFGLLAQTKRIIAVAA
jgi:hypothetical protein